MRNWILAAATAVFASLTFSIVPVAAFGTGSGTPLNISQIPLTVVIPQNPQVMIAITNSNSMDSSDNVVDDSNINSTTGAPGSSSNRVATSAIMTGSGGDPSYRQTTLAASPVNYQVPEGFTAPVTGATSGSTPYLGSINGSTAFYWSGGNGWTCVDGHNNNEPAWYASWLANGTHNVISVPPPGGQGPNAGPNPTPPSGWPADKTWDPMQVWYWDGANFYDASGNLITAAGKVPSVKDKLNGTEMRIAGIHQGGLHEVGTGVGGGGGSGGGGVACDGNPFFYLYVWHHVQPNPSTAWGDNSPSRLNIAKAAIYQVIKQYGTQVSFGLMDYNTYSVAQLVGGHTPARSTWIYYMSPSGGWQATNFSATYSAPTLGDGPGTFPTAQWVLNPCYQAQAWVWTYMCQPLENKLAGLWNSTPAATQALVGSSKYVQVAGRSDDPLIDDVMIPSSGFFGYGGLLYNTPTPASTTLESPTPASPYTGPGSYSIGDYNCGQASGCHKVTEYYSNFSASLGGYTPGPPPDGIPMYPTNSGYVPYAPQVMYAPRGSLWIGSVSYNTGNIIVPVQAAAGSDNASQQNYLKLFAPSLTPENTVAPGDADNSAVVPGLFPDSTTPPLTYATYYGSAIQSSAPQSPMAGMLTSILSKYSSGPSKGQYVNWPSLTTTSGCVPPRYVILMTDGLPTQDLKGNLWPPPGSAAAHGYNVVVNFNSDGSVDTNPADYTNGTANQAVIDTINQITAMNAAGIKTFVVGLGAGVDKSLNPEAAKVLTAMAKAGGTVDYYPAVNATVVAADMSAILTIINNLNVASVSGAVNSTSLQAGTVIYQSSYTGYDLPYGDWTGDLKAFHVNANGTVQTSSFWSVQSLLDSANWGTGRMIVTCGTTPGGTAAWGSGCAPGSGEPFRWSSLSSADQTAIGSSDVLNFLRGDTSKSQAYGGTLRSRSHVLGDIVNSAALYVATSSGPYVTDPSYQAFIASTQSRTPMLYAGANDGMLHAFNAATGAEVFGFIPNGVFSDLAALANPNYNNSHQFYVDGSPSAGDVKFSSGSLGCADGTQATCWHTVLVGGLNDGGHSIYALDITDPSSMSTEPNVAKNVLWEYTDSSLGLTYSQPKIADTANGFEVFFGSGYYTQNMGSDYLYVLNAQTGALVKKINLCAAVASACSSTLPNGLSSVTVLNSAGQLGSPADTVYAGDLQGNLWKVNIPNNNYGSNSNNNWTVTLIFQSRDPSGNPQPITTAPVVSLSPDPKVSGNIVYFGTGQYLGQADLNNGQVETMYGILDTCPGSLSSCSYTAPTRNNLQPQTLASTSETINGNATTLRTVSNHSVNWAEVSGWYIDLGTAVNNSATGINDAGERVITNPRLYDGEVVFTTFVPAAAALCQSGGHSYLMAVNFATGASFPQPQLDINSDGKLDGSDQVNDENPVGIGLGNVYASAPTILAANLGAISAVKIVTLSSPTFASYGNFQSIGETTQKPAAAWTQLR